jgi:hypothetical protein
LISLVMTTATATPVKKDHAFYSAAAGGITMTFRNQPVEMQADGSAIVRGVKIFKAGTFRDSWGEQRTWTVEHLAQFVANFNLLRDGEIFTDVPVRRDHSNSVDKVMGYFEAMFVEGDKLVADFHVTDAEQIPKLATGTFRNVSLEVGMYVTNDETAYWPVAFGVAYVDIPAVEGLHNKETPRLAFFSQIVETPHEGDPTVTTTPVTPADVGAAKPVAEHGTPAAPAPAAAAPAAPATFRINGAETSDHAAVQAHIATLESFAASTVESGRLEFVSGLVTGNKIVAGQKEAFETLVKTLSDEQYEAFKASYATAPAMSLLANHGAGNPNPDGEPDKAVDELEIARDTVAMHRRAGMSEEKIATTKAGKQLAAALTVKS